MAEEQKLIEAANRGDVGAMERLYLENREWVFRVARRFCDSDHDAHDAVQEVFKYFFTRFPGFVLTCRLKTYLYPITRNKTIDLLRKSNRLIPMGDETPEPEAPEQRDEEAERRAVMDLVADLSDEQRDIVIARFADGLSLEEMATLFNIPKGTVKSRLHHALNRLRRKKE